MQGYWLMLARISWIVLVLPALGLYITSLPGYFAVLHMISASKVRYFTGRLTLEDVHTLQAWGLSLDFYAVGMIVVSLLFQFSYAAVGILLFWRKSDDRMALLASFSMMMFPFGFADLTLQAVPPAWKWVIPFLSILGNSSIMLTAYVFPNGKFVPAWTRWLALFMLGFWATDFFPFLDFNRSMVKTLLFFGLVASTMVLQLYRYRFASTPRQRRQTRWVVLGISIAVVIYIGGRLFTQFILPPLLPGSLFPSALEVILITFSMLLIPPTLGIAILSARLWDIDVIINRTLVYGALTTALAVVYTGLVIGLQYLLHGLTGGNQLAIVGSTLAIVILFQPLRQRIQMIIDRRFYRSNYDAARTLAAFSATLRNELDLEQLSEQVVAVIQETMQPRHVSLWLRQPERETKPGTKSRYE